MRAEPSPVDSSSSGRSDPLKSEVYPISRSPSDGGQRAIVPASEEEAEVLHASIKAGSVAQIVVAARRDGGLCFPLNCGVGFKLSAPVVSLFFESKSPRAYRAARSRRGPASRFASA